MKALSVFLYITAMVLTVFFINYLTNIIGDSHYEQKENKHLYDIIHEYTPDLYKYRGIVNLIGGLLTVSLFIVPGGDNLLKELFFKFLLVLLIRALCIVSTILPKHEDCKAQYDLTFYLTGGCYDKVFSGHTSYVTLITLIYLREKIINLAGFWGINIFNMLAIATTRSHYTVDVILGFVITYLVYDGDYSIFTNFFKGIGK
jgi:PAP2 superfamily C-terminal